jgi:phosphate transport system permease protein
MSLRRAGEKIIEGLVLVSGTSAIVFVFAIFFFVFREGSDFLFHRLDLV